MRSNLAPFIVFCAIFFETLGASAQDAPPPAPDAPPAPKRYLLVGDSMAFALGTALEPMVEGEGHKFSTITRVSDSIQNYAADNQMKTDLQGRKADVVIILLGTNEVLNPKPEKLIKPIQKIVQQVGGRECYWVGPPLWKQDPVMLNMVQVLGQNTGPCRFFDSTPVVMERQKDRIHPTHEGSKVWAQVFYDWLKAQPTLAPATPPTPPTEPARP